MDYNLISRLDSHSKDLFRLPKRRLVPVREEDELHEEETSVKDHDTRDLPPPVEWGSFPSGLDKEDEDSPDLSQHYEDLWGAITRNIGKGFVIGYGGKVFINSLFPLLNLMRGRKVHLSGKELLLNAREYGLFLGSLLGIHNGLMFESRKLEMNTHYRAFFSGFAAGTALLWVPEKRRWPIVLFTLVRSIELQGKLLARRRILPSLDNGDTMLMSLASASMIHSWIFHPETLDHGYTKFLTLHSQIPPIVHESLREMYRGGRIDVVALNKKRARLRGFAMRLSDPRNYDSLKPGEIIHPTRSTLHYLGLFFARAMSLSIPVYLPVFLVPILLFYPSALVTKPRETTKRIFKGAMRSSLFLSMYCTVGIGSLSVLRRMGLTYKNVGGMSHVLFMIAGALGGVTTILEKKNRRIELALYVLSKAIEGRWNQAVQAGLVKPIRNAEVLVFCFCFGIITHCFTRHPQMLREAYFSLLSRFFDRDERHKFYEMPRIVSTQVLSTIQGSFTNLAAASRKREKEENRGTRPGS